MVKAAEQDEKERFGPSTPPQPYTGALLKSRLVKAKPGESWAWYEGDLDWKSRIRARHERLR